MIAYVAGSSECGSHGAAKRSPCLHHCLCHFNRKNYFITIDQSSRNREVRLCESKLKTSHNYPCRSLRSVLGTRHLLIRAPVFFGHMSVNRLYASVCNANYSRACTHTIKSAVLTSSPFCTAGGPPQSHPKRKAAPRPRVQRPQISCLWPLRSWSRGCFAFRQFVWKKKVFYFP